MAHFEKTKERNEIYKGRILKLNRDKVELEDGSESFREYVIHNGGATIIAEKDGYIYFVEQFRYAYGEVVLELPAGKVEEGEDPKVCAKRELEEETGLISDNIESLGYIYPSPGYTNEKIYMYAAFDCKEGKTHFDDGEFLDIKKIKIEEVKKMMMDGTIKDSKTLVALFKYFKLEEK